MLLGMFFLIDIYKFFGLQTTITRTVEQNEYHHYLSFRHRSVTMVFTFVFIWYGIFFHHLVKKLAEIICLSYPKKS